MRINSADLMHSMVIIVNNTVLWGFTAGASGEKPTCHAGDIEMQVQSLDQEDPPKEGMATHSNILAWRIPWTEEPGMLQSIGSHRVRQTEAT